MGTTVHCNPFQSACYLHPYFVFRPTAFPPVVRSNTLVCPCTISYLRFQAHHSLIPTTRITTYQQRREIIAIVSAKILVELPTVLRPHCCCERGNASQLNRELIGTVGERARYSASSLPRGARVSTLPRFLYFLLDRLYPRIPRVRVNS